MQFLKRLSAAATALALLLVCLTAQAANFKLVDTQGKAHSLADYRGKWVLVNFWATWCPPCLQEIPEFAALYGERKARDLMVIGVAVDYADADEVIEFAEGLGMSYPLVLAAEGTAAQFGKVSVLPVSYLYDRKGKLVLHRIGPLSRAEIERYMSGR